MRALLSALTFALVLASGTAQADEELARALERSGYFTGLDDSQAASLRRDIVSNGYAGAMHHNRRVASANTQAFAAGGVSAWLRNDIAPLLASRGVTFRPADDRLAADGSAYSVVIGTDEFPMWRVGEVNAEVATTVAAFAMVNRLLESIRAPERLYLFGNGSAGQAWLLTPVQAHIIRAVAPPEAAPYMPAYPNYPPTPISTPTRTLGPPAVGPLLPPNPASIAPAAPTPAAASALPTRPAAIDPLTPLTVDPAPGRSTNSPPEDPLASEAPASGALSISQPH